MSVVNIISRLFLLVLISTSFCSAKDVKLFFNPESISLKPMEKKSIELWIENSPKVYGVELQIEFDKEFISIVDKDSKEVKKVVSGDFFDTKKSLIIQNQVDNEKATISYLLTLLNPAKEIEGKGKLLSFTIESKKVGNTNIKFKVAKLGTKKGDVVLPTINNLNIQIKTVSDMVVDKWYLILGAIILILLILIVFRKKK